jgi:microcystin-dependent protein
MSEPFLGEIRPFAGNFAPRGWALCDGQLLSIAQNTALFSILGTAYGGDGRVTFALPNLQGRTPIGAGQGPGLSDRPLGESFGSSSVTLINSELPAHHHTFNGSREVATAGSPEGQVLASTSALPVYHAPKSDRVALNPTSIAPSGGSQPHNNLQPYLALTFIIALEGIFPSRG